MYLFLKRKPDALLVSKIEEKTIITQKAQDLLKENDIILIIDNLKEAVKIFNLISKTNKKVLAAFMIDRA